MRCSFAEFLVERGAISDAEGASVRTWAQQNRDLLGSIAMEHGLLTSEQVRAVVAHADAAIVGSALVRRMETAIDAGGDAVNAAREFVGELAGGL